MNSNQLTLLWFDMLHSSSWCKTGRGSSPRLPQQWRSSTSTTGRSWNEK